MDAVQALAILSLGAFVTVLITAVFYMFTVRPRLLTPESAATPRALDDKLHTELVEQRLLIEKMGTTLSRHTAELTAARTGTGTLGPGLDNMRSVLDTQLVAVRKIGSMLLEQADKLAAIDSRIQQQDQRLTGLDTRLSAYTTRAGDEQNQFGGMLQAQSERLVTLSERLDEWSISRQEQDAKLADYALILTELDRELAAQASLAQQLDARVSEQIAFLRSAAEDRRKQAGVLESLHAQFSQLLPKLESIIEVVPATEQNRLTEIEGIGPVYSGKLYDAGITTFQQIAAMTPEELNTLIGAPEWRARSIDTKSWIEQAKHLAAEREKVETIQ